MNVEDWVKLELGSDGGRTEGDERGSSSRHQTQLSISRLPRLTFLTFYFTVDIPARSSSVLLNLPRSETLLLLEYGGSLVTCYAYRVVWSRINKTTLKVSWGGI